MCDLDKVNSTFVFPVFHLAEFLSEPHPLLILEQQDSALVKGHQKKKKKKKTELSEESVEFTQD